MIGHDPIAVDGPCPPALPLIVMSSSHAILALRATHPVAAIAVALVPAALLVAAAVAAAAARHRVGAASDSG